MAAPHTTDAEIVATLKAYAEAGSLRGAGRLLGGLHNSIVQNRLDLAKARGLTADSPVITEEEKLRTQLRRARADIASLQREHETAAAIRREIFELAERTPEPPKWLTPERKGSSGQRGVPMTIWSDWHFGEVVRPEEVGGFNEFSTDIAKARISVLVDETIDLCLNHMGKPEHTYPGIIVCLGGDMITGDIHEELTATNDRTTQQSINELTDTLISALERMADVFGKVFVPCVVGNHGRGTMKPRMKNRVYTSHEWVIYTSLDRHFRRDKRVQFFIPDESDAYFKVYNHRFLLTHGDSLGVKGGDGIIGSLGPIARGALKVGRSEAQIGRDIDTIVMGHWHQYLTFPGVIVNNALKGYDEFARLALRAPYSRPSQALWFVHPKHGITAHWQVFLDDRREPEKVSSWVQWKETD